MFEKTGFVKKDIIIGHMLLLRWYMPNFLFYRKQEKIFEYKSKRSIVKMAEIIAIIMVNLVLHAILG